MLRIAGQTAGSIGLNFLGDTHGCPGCQRQKIRFFLFLNIFTIFSHWQRRALQLVVYKWQNKWPRNKKVNVLPQICLKSHPVWVILYNTVVTRKLCSCPRNFFFKYLNKFLAYVTTRPPMSAVHRFINNVM